MSAQHLAWRTCPVHRQLVRIRLDYRAIESFVVYNRMTLCIGSVITYLLKQRPIEVYEAYRLYTLLGTSCSQSLWSKSNRYLFCLHLTIIIIIMIYVITYLYLYCSDHLVPHPFVLVMLTSLWMPTLFLCDADFQCGHSSCPPCIPPVSDIRMEDNPAYQSIVMESAGSDYI